MPVNMEIKKALLLLRGLKENFLALVKLGESCE
jgi:hypothetical protein